VIEAAYEIKDYKRYLIMIEDKLRRDHRKQLKIHMGDKVYLDAVTQSGGDLVNKQIEFYLTGKDE
jgi:hypothetical protein